MSENKHTPGPLNNAWLQLWQSYCDKKAELEGAAEKIEALEDALREARDTFETIRQMKTEPHYSLWPTRLREDMETIAFGGVAKIDEVLK